MPSVCGIEVGKCYLSDAEQAQVKNLEGLRMLFEGKHKRYFLDEARTQHIYKAVGPNGRNLLYITENLPGRCVFKYADLLFGEELVIGPAVEAPAVAEAIARIGAASAIHPLLFQAAVEASWAGRAWWQVRVREGQVRLEQVAPESVFAEYDASGDLVAATIKFAVTIQGERYARCIRHERGKIIHELWHLAKGTDRVDGAADLAVAEAGLQPEEATKIEDLVIIEHRNFSTGGAGASDFDGEVTTLIDDVNNRRSQISRVLDVHGDPTVEVDAQLFDAEGNAKISGRAVKVDDMSRPSVRYVTWEAQLTEAAKALENATASFLGQMEIAPQLVGLGGGTSADSWKKFKLSAVQTLARVNRKRLWMAPSIQRAYAVAMAMENAWTPGVSYPVAPVALTWSDGLPVDDEELMRVVTGYKEAGLISEEMALTWMHGDPKVVKVERERLLADREARLPTAFRGDGMTHIGQE
jgi:hypothetical protein